MFASIIVSKAILNNLIPIFIPYLGLSVHTKAVVLYTSIILLYLSFKFIVNIILFRYEPSQKNKNIQSIAGAMFGLVNAIIILTLSLSMILYNFQISNQMLNKLNKSQVFNYINQLNRSIFNHGN